MNIHYEAWIKVVMIIQQELLSWQCGVQEGKPNYIGTVQAFAHVTYGGISIGQSKSHDQIQHKCDMELYFSNEKRKSKYFLSNNLI